MLVLRRLAALLTALLLLFQADWQGSGAACLAAHAASHGGSKTVPATAAGVQTGVQTAAATTHDGMMGMTSAHRVPDQASAVAASPSTGDDETVPAHCPVSGIPAACAAMMACSGAATTTSAAPLLATDAWQVGERAAESDARPYSRDTVPDVPPPRA